MIANVPRKLATMVGLALSLLLLPGSTAEAVPTCALTCWSRAILYQDREGWNDGQTEDYYLNCAIKACSTTCKYPDCVQL